MRHLPAPWTWVGPKRTEDEGGVYFTLRVVELEGFLVAARTEEEVRAEAEIALEGFLDSFVARGDPLPSPLWRVGIYVSEAEEPVASRTQPSDAPVSETSATEVARVSLHAA